MLAYRLPKSEKSLQTPYFGLQGEPLNSVANNKNAGFNPLEALEIFEPERQIKVISRPINSDILQYLASANLSYGFKWVLPSGQSLSSKLLTSHALPNHFGRDAFLADLNHLSELYLDLIGCPNIGVRLEVLNAAMCPKFHVDKTGIRMLCTYIGQGTQWLDDAYADRSKLGMATVKVDDSDSGLILNQCGVHEVPTFAIALLKGSLWQGNHMRGIIHRSPAIINNQTRILLALDAIW